MTGSVKLTCKDNIKQHLDVYKECLQYDDPIFDKGYCGNLLYNNLNDQFNPTNGGGKNQNKKKNKKRLITKKKYNSNKKLKKKRQKKSKYKKRKSKTKH